MARIRRKSLIPRYNIPYTTRTLITSAPTPDSPFTNTGTSYEFVRAAAEYCTVQATSGYDINLIPEGERSNEMYTIFTNTPLHTALSNTNSLSSSVYIPEVFFGVTGAGGWFNTVKSKPRLNNIINHHEIIVAKDYNLTSNEGLGQFPSTTGIDALITSKEDLLNSDIWLPQWLSENI